MDGIITRIGRMLGLRVQPQHGPVPTVQQDRQEVPLTQNPTPIDRKMKFIEASAKVHELRDKGLTYHAIGQQLGFSRQRVHQIISATKRIAEKNSHWTNGLKTRNIELLDRLNITNAKEAKVWVEVGEIRPFKWPNYGLRSYNELCKWLEITPPTHSTHRTPKTCPHCNQSL